MTLILLDTDVVSQYRCRQTWATIATGAQRRGRPRPLNDSWIAACCIESGCRF